jgi:hypothetical protein
MEMQGLMASIIMGRLKEHLFHGVSPDTDLFLSMFLIRLPPSMRESVGAGNHKTAVVMVSAADVLWDASGAHDPIVSATTTQRSRSPAPTGGWREEERQNEWQGPFQKSPSFRLQFLLFSQFVSSSGRQYAVLQHRCTMCTVPVYKPLCMQ